MRSVQSRHTFIFCFFFFFITYFRHPWLPWLFHTIYMVTFLWFPSVSRKRAKTRLPAVHFLSFILSYVIHVLFPSLFVQDVLKEPCEWFQTVPYLLFILSLFIHVLFFFFVVYLKTGLWMVRVSSFFVNIITLFMYFSPFPSGRSKKKRLINGPKSFMPCLSNLFPCLWLCCDGQLETFLSTLFFPSSLNPSRSGH